MNLSRRRFVRRAAAFGFAGAVLTHEGTARAVQAAVQAAGDRSPETFAADEDFWFQIQQAFTIDRSVINLNNGGVSPSPAMVQGAMRRHLEHSNNAPSLTMWQQLKPLAETVRERLAGVFGCSSAEIAITRNASESLEICIYGMDLSAGDEVVACELDYPRMLNTYRQREQRDGIKLQLAQLRSPIQDPQEVVDAYAQLISPRTKVILCSHVVFLTGQIMPVRALCRLGARHGVPVVVDGAHAFAHLPFKRDDLACEYYGTSLHKWMTAPHGTGLLYVHRDRIADLWPLMAAPEPRGDDIRKFEEIGTHPSANRLAISEAVTIFESLGAERKAVRMRYLRDRWAKRLASDSRVHFAAKLDETNSCGFTTMSIDGIDPDALSKHLWHHHRIVVVPISGFGINGIRVSPNVYTTTGEVDMFSRAVEAVLANGLPA